MDINKIKGSFAPAALVVILLILFFTAACQSSMHGTADNTDGPAPSTVPPAALSGKPDTAPTVGEPQPLSFVQKADQERYILPDSDKKLLFGSDLEGLNAGALGFARNEIYARHGYVFADNDCRSYFTNKSWYKENPGFDESVLSDTEKRNVRLIKQYEDKVKACGLKPLGDSEAADLDGDGVKDEISLDCKAGGDSYTLTINGVSVEGRGSNMDGELFVCDIDSRDKFREIAITESGPSSDEATYFYYYDGKNINFMGRIQGAEHDIIMTGTGTFTSRSRGQILHTWFYTDWYKLSAEHVLENIPQPSYKMGTRVRLQKRLELQKAPGEPETAAVLEPGDEAVITATDDREWCEVDTLKGVKGWFAVEGFSTIRGTHSSASEYFEGLCSAD